MRIITLLVYLFIGVIVAWFAAQNWDRTALWLPGGYEAYWPLGAYIIFALLLGIVPLSILHSMSRWRWKRKIRKLEKKLAAETEANQPVPASSEPLPGRTPMTAAEPSL